MRISSLRNLLGLLAFAFLMPRPAAASPPIWLFDWGCTDDTLRLPPFFLCGNDSPGQFELPTAVAVGPDGSVYTTEAWLGRVQKFSAQGEFLGEWSAPGIGGKLAVAPDGSVYLARGTVFHFAADGTLLDSWAGGGSRGIAVDPNGDVYVLHNGFLGHYTAEGVLVASWGGGEFTQPGSLSFPWGIACDGDGHIHVMDSVRSLQTFDAQGNLVAAWPSTLDGGPRFSGFGMSRDPDGALLMAIDNRVLRMSVAGDTLASWIGPAPGFRSYDVARSPNGLYYVVDVANGRINVFGSVTAFRTNPPGAAVRVDGTLVTTPVWMDWAPGSSHSVEAPAFYQTESVQARFGGWEDGGSRIRTVVAADPPGVYVADYSMTYRLTVHEGAGVHVHPKNVWMVEGAPVTLHATMDAPIGSVNWNGTGSGSFTGTGFQAVVVPQGPITEDVTYVPETDQFAYDFSLSASDVDPFANTAPATGGVRSVYLWMTCGPQGLAAFETGVTGSLTPLGFEPLNGCLNALTPTHVMLAVPACPSGFDVNVLLGRWNFFEPAEGGTFCLAPSPNGFVGAVDCDPLDPTLTVDVGVRGFDSSGGVPCAFGVNTCGFAAARAARTAGDVASGPGFTILGVAPNPFADGTELRFSLSHAAPVRVSVYDVAGRLVARVRDREMPAGENRVPWTGLDSAGRRVGPGIYFLRLDAAGERQTRKVVRRR